MVRETLHTKLSNQRQALLIFLSLLYSIPETLPYQNIINPLFTILIIGLTCFPHIKKIPILFIKVEIFIKLGSFLIEVLHTILLLDLYIIVENHYYSYSKTTICMGFLYIIYKENSTILRFFTLH